MSYLFDLYSLNKSERAATSAIVGLFEEGITQTAALQAYRGAGGKIANGSWSDLWNALEGQISASRAAKGTPVNQLIPLIAHGQSVTKLSQNFSYNVSFDGYSKDLGISGTYNRTVTSDTRLTPDQITSMLPTIMGQSNTATIIDPTSVSITGALVSNDYGGS